MTTDRAKVDIEPMLALVNKFAPGKSEALGKLVSRLNPTIYLDRKSRHLLFAADCANRTIVLGLEASRRLQALAYATSIMLSSIGKGEDERRRRLPQADILLNWAVGSELQQWLKQAVQLECDISEIFKGASPELPDRPLSQLNLTERTIGEGIFRAACAFIFMHEIAHIERDHVSVAGFWSLQQEKEADLFAAEWLVDDESLSPTDRLTCLLGISLALVWPTVFEIYLGGRRRETHPAGYDRLYQVLNQVIRQDVPDEYAWVWGTVALLLFTHMHSADYDFDADRMGGDPRDEVNYLIDLIAIGSQQSAIQ